MALKELSGNIDLRPVYLAIEGLRLVDMPPDTDPRRYIAPSADVYWEREVGYLVVQYQLTDDAVKVIGVKWTRATPRA